jgi:GR25 family glycosyltransferase involved in LPS biosynthesis
MKNSLLLILVVVLLITVILYNKKQEIVKSSNKYKAYVINLDDRPDRFDTITRNFDNAPFVVERFSAIRDSVGWKGCGLSHMAITQIAKDSSMPSILIMEDDCKPSKDFNTSWPLIKNWLDSNKGEWDIFVGGTTYYDVIYNSSDNIKPICKLDSNIKLYYTKLLCLHFYYLNSSAYDKFLEWKKDITKNGAVDMWPNIINMKIVTSTPFIATQTDGYSNIGNGHATYSVAFKESDKLIASIQNNSACDLNKS